MKNELVKVITKDGLYLSGLFSNPLNSKKVILHIHGFEGDFFSNSFVSIQGTMLSEKDISFLTVQTRGTSLRQELINEGGEAIYNGSYYELLEEAYLDIDAWIEFLTTKGFEEIILQGHSLGTIKVIRYIFEGGIKDKVSRLILLAPFDKTWLLDNAAKQVNKSPEELRKIAKEMVEKGKGDEIAPYGFDDVPHSYKNFLSWYSTDDLGKMFDFFDKEYAFPILNKIQIPTLIIVGNKDEFFNPSNPEMPEEAMSILSSNIKNSKGIFIEGSEHVFKGFEKELVNFIINNI